MSAERAHQVEAAEVNPQAYTPEQFQTILSQWKKDFHETQSYRGPDGRIEEDDYKKAYDLEIRKLIAKLVGEKEKFKHIFETDKGSAYFMLKSGESLRIKCSNGKFDEFSIHPLLKDIFFVPQQEQERMLKIVKESGRYYDGLLGVPFETNNLAEGVCPVELNMYFHDRSSDASLVRSGNSIKIISAKHEWDQYRDWLEDDQQGQISNGIHVGHPVTKVIK